MNNDKTFRRVAAITAIISAPLALGASIVLAQTLEFDAEVMSNPANLITLGTKVAEVFRNAEFIGMFGYYLLLLPATLYLWYWLVPNNSKLVSMATIFGLGYIFIGAIGSAVLVNVASPLMNEFPQVSKSQQDVMQTVFQVVTNLGIAALLSLSNITGGIWWLGIGWELQSKRRILGIVTIVQGIVTFVYGVGVMMHIETLTSLEALTFFAPIWALWLGVVIWRSDWKGVNLSGA